MNWQIPLYGYGGYAKVKILDAFKDTNGKVWLSLGTLFSGTTKLRANIKLQNTGDLRSFAKIKVVPKGSVKPVFVQTLHTSLK